MTAARQRETTYLGAAALGGYCLHAAYHLWRGEPQDLLWVCNLASAVVGIGLLARSARIASAGTLILCVGTPLWLFDLATGGEYIGTSLFTHVLGIAIGLWAVFYLGMPHGSWWRAIGLIVILIIVSRLVTPPAFNVNLAFAVHPSATRYFHNHLLYLISTLMLTAGYLWIVEIILRRLVSVRTAGESSS